MGGSALPDNKRFAITTNWGNYRGTNAMSLIAQWLMARRYIEHWWVWMAVDTLSIGLYWHKSLWFSSGLYTIYLIFCVQGIRLWKKYIHE